MRINATGGWWDAGDYLKFTETTSYTVAMMLQGIVSFPAQLGGGSGKATARFTAEARFGLDFLQRMWNERTRTLYLQVGTGEANSYYFGDHDIWRLPQADDDYHGTNPRYQYIRHPPVFRAGPPGAPISPNLAGPGRRLRALLPRLPLERPGYAARACARPRPSTHWPARTGRASCRRCCLGLLPGGVLARRHDARRHRARARAEIGRARRPARSAAGSVGRRPGRRRALGQPVDRGPGIGPGHPEPV